jgi:dihydroxy-acid dehydratase
MGTASTMAVVAEALGMTIPGFAGTPAPDSRLLSMSHETGRLIVEMVAEGRRPSDIMTRESILNAIIAVAAVGGSTNSVMHLLAIAGRLGLDIALDDFDAAGRDVPLLANLQPSGQFLMDDLFRAGGVLALLSQIKEFFHPEPITVTGKPFADYLAGQAISHRAAPSSSRRRPPPNS